MPTLRQAVSLLAIATSAAIFGANAEVEALNPNKLPITDSGGNIRYMVLLDEDVASGEPETGELPPLSTRDPAGRGDFRSWHKASVRHLVKRLERDYEVSAVSMTSWAMPSFAAYFPPGAIKAMGADSRVKLAFPLYKDQDQFATWGNRWDGSELVSWGKQAIGTDDSLTSTNTVYMIDGGPSAHSDLSNLVFPLNPVNPTSILAPGHADHVAGILTADNNNSMVRGINPSSTVINVNRGTSTDEFAAAFDWVLQDSETNGIFGVANFSTSGSSFAQGGNLNYILRRISNRVLIVQAAGNFTVDACTQAYGPANPDDGILVVGGTDESGAWSGYYDNTVSGYGSSSGSNTNAGGCIEVWAPSQRITSAWNTSTIATMELSGTSMAAPHISGLAARWGNNATRPVEREHFINSHRFFTGYYDPASSPIYMASAAVSVGSPPHRIAAASVSADATMSGTSPSNVNDGLYLTGNWSAGHGAPGWIELDLGSSHFITSIRMVPEQNPSTGTVSHSIYVGNSPSPMGLAGSYSGTSTLLEPISVNIAVSGRYVRIYTNSSPSWVAWREIEIYGV